MDALFFYAFAAMTLLGAVLAITRRNVVHAAIWLIVSLLGVAGLYLLQHAEFLFAVQIILYIGGIMVLFLFVIMLVNLDLAERERQFNRQWPMALAVVALAGAEILYFVTSVKLPPAIATSPQGNTEQFATILFSEYLLPFEIASVLLLVAIVGSVFMAKKQA